MQSLTSIHDYLRTHSEEIGARILSSYPALHGADEAPSPLLSQMVRVPYPAQTLAIMGVSKRWQLASNANVVAECGSGKTLIALGSMLVHSAGRPFSGLVMAPPHLVEKWARETFLTLPQVRVFLIDDMRNGGDPTQPHGINEVRLRRGEIVREGLHTSLAELRRLGRKGWRDLCPGPRSSALAERKPSSPILEALLRQKPLRTVSWFAYQSGYRLSCRDGWGAAECARLREEAPAPDRGGLEGREDQVLRALAGGRQQDCPHGAGGIHGSLHAGMVGLRHCGRNPPTGGRHGPGECPWRAQQNGKTVSGANREQLRRGIDVAICHPKIVETGLDLLDFPTILFHETGYSLHTLRQASRRSWRIGQRRPVEVKFFAYKGTMQEVCLRLMGKKLLVALAMEGKFTSEGLQAIDGDDDMLTAMARELVENKGIGESADSIWRALGQMRPSTSARAEEGVGNMAIEHAETDVPTILPMPIDSIPGAALLEAASSSRRSPRRDTPAGQLSLF